MTGYSREVRCESCGALLAMIQNGRLAIRRGGLHATFDGEYCAHLICYAPRCRALNNVRLPEPPAFPRLVGA